MPRASRREALQSSYHFGCVCARCEEEKHAPAKITYAKSKNSHGQKGAKARERKAAQRQQQREAANAYVAPVPALPGGDRLLPPSSGCGEPAVAQTSSTDVSLSGLHLGKPAS
jgi:hypothetical protein